MRSDQLCHLGRLAAGILILAGTGCKDLTRSGAVEATEAPPATAVLPAGETVLLAATMAAFGGGLVVGKALWSEPNAPAPTAIDTTLDLVAKLVEELERDD